MLRSRAIFLAFAMSKLVVRTRTSAACGKPQYFEAQRSDLPIVHPLLLSPPLPLKQSKSLSICACAGGRRRTYHHRHHQHHHLITKGLLAASAAGSWWWQSAICLPVFQIFCDFYSGLIGRRRRRRRRKKRPTFFFWRSTWPLG